MNEAKQETPEAPAARAHQPTLRELLGEQTWREWLGSVRAGLRKPRGLGQEPLNVFRFTGYDGLG